MEDTKLIKKIKEYLDADIKDNNDYWGDYRDYLNLFK